MTRRVPRFRSKPGLFHPKTNRRMERFARSGESGEPCGMPRRCSRVFRPRSSVSSTGQSSHILIRCRTCPSPIRLADRLEKVGMRSAPEVVREVGVDDFRWKAPPCHDAPRYQTFTQLKREVGWGVSVSFHQREISPEVLETFRAAEECGEVRRVHEHDISGTLSIWRHPKKAVELRVAGCGERMRTVGVNRLTRQQVHQLGVVERDLVVRQVRMEIECRDVLKQAALVNVPKSR